MPIHGKSVSLEGRWIDHQGSHELVNMFSNQRLPRELHGLYGLFYVSKTHSLSLLSLLLQGGKITWTYLWERKKGPSSLSLSSPSLPLSFSPWRLRRRIRRCNSLQYPSAASNPEAMPPDPALTSPLSSPLLLVFVFDPIKVSSSHPSSFQFSLISFSSWISCGWDLNGCFGNLNLYLAIFSIIGLSWICAKTYLGLTHCSVEIDIYASS